MAQLNHEPSMEDILASIKRIIAEDSEAAVTRSPRIRREMAAVAAPSVVEEAEAEPAPLADAVVVPVFDSVPDLSEPASVAEPEEEEADVLELTSPIAEEIHQPSAEPLAAPAPVAEAAPEPIAAPEAEIPTARLMSDPAANASRNAFAALSQMQVRVEEGQENSLEGLVSDLLRPMLREWLDRELPGLVEKLVSAEIARVSGRG